MTSIKTLPLLEGTKLIVLDEGVDAMYARKLIAGWIQMWKDKDPSHMIDLLSFSDPKSAYQNEPELFSYSSVIISDYYTVDINMIDINVIQEKDFDTLDHILKTLKTKSTVIVDCLTSLILFVGLSKALWFLERLSKQVPKLICIYRRDFMENKIPCIETLGTTYVKIEQSFDVHNNNNNINYLVEIIHRKMGGSILKQRELVTQNCTSYEIQSDKIVKQNKKSTPCESQKQKIESSFRIEMNENEMKQRNETVLPYLINTNATDSSKIYYQPEDIDDIDEEDPDDDLCF